MNNSLPPRSPRTPRGGKDLITEMIIAYAIEVHRLLGPGLLETTYEEALCHELHLRNIPFERQKDVDILYKGTIIKGQRIDLVVDGQVVVEIKAVKAFNDIFTSQTLSYLRSTGLKRALIINFSAAKLVSGVKRISL